MDQSPRQCPLLPRNGVLKMEKPEEIMNTTICALRIAVLIACTACLLTAPAPAIAGKPTSPAAPAGVAAPPPGDTRPPTVLERRYKVEALNFKCLDETWYDSPWFSPWISDEVMVILRDPDRKVMSISRVFSDVDTKETRAFENHESCILPVQGVSNTYLRAPRDSWACSETGIAGPFNFTVEMYEADSDDWNGAYYCFLQLDCGFEVPIGYQTQSSIFTKGDELIGTRSLVFPVAELEAAMPQVGNTFQETITLGPCHDHRGCVTSPGLPTGPEYEFTWRLTRLPDRIIDPVIDPDL